MQTYISKHKLWRSINLFTLVRAFIHVRNHWLWDYAQHSIFALHFEPRHHHVATSLRMLQHDEASSLTQWRISITHSFRCVHTLRIKSAQPKSSMESLERERRSCVKSWLVGVEYTVLLCKNAFCHQKPHFGTLQNGGSFRKRGVHFLSKFGVRRSDPHFPKKCVF